VATTANCEVTQNRKQLTVTKQYIVKLSVYWNGLCYSNCVGKVSLCSHSNVVHSVSKQALGAHYKHNRHSKLHNMCSWSVSGTSAQISTSPIHTLGSRKKTKTREIPLSVYVIALLHVCAEELGVMLC
jgi:aromatic ring hydroxylase